MTIAEIEKMLEEAIKYWNDKDERKTDLLKCLLEISKNNNINGHKHVYAYLEDFGRDEYLNEYATIKLILK